MKMTPELVDETKQEYGATPNSAEDDNRIHEYFIPFKRLSGEWSPGEVTKTAFMAIFVFPLRLFYLCLAGLIMMIIASVSMIGAQPSRVQDKPVNGEDGSETSLDENDPLFAPPAIWRRFLVSLLFPMARSILFFSFGVYNIKSDSAHPESMASNKTLPASKAYVIVANHLGYIDILILLCRFHASFVAKGELEKVMFVGTIARALQCMFVRRGQSLTSQLISRVQATYECHRRRENCPGCAACMSKLVIFPEGTTANGTAMIPFRTGVFNAGVPVLPVCIRFPWRSFNLSWETIRFREHMFRAMTQFRNHVHCTVLPVYVPSPEEETNARLYAFNVQKAMQEVLDQPIVPLNRKHKLLYHGYLLGKETSAEGVLQKAHKLTQEDEQLLYVIERTKGDEKV
ncbi:lysophospholipid acyltransferase LPEAT1 isoform X1 [Gracilaria domingensis]|nr:lysophospholipid acyltransferase LPEAT1 isoform X1 [Gracilaria domingensis]